RPSSKPKQQDSKQKVLTNTFPPPIPWQKEQITLTLNSQQFHQTQISATSITPNRSHLKSDIEAYLSENDLTASDDVIRISSQKGEMFGRILEERTSESNNRTGQRSIHFLAYGIIDGQEYVLTYEFVYNELTSQLLNGSIKTLQGDGYEADYVTGQGFRIYGTDVAIQSQSV